MPTILIKKMAALSAACFLCLLFPFAIAAQKLQVNAYRFEIRVLENNDSIYAKAHINLNKETGIENVHLDFKNGKNSQPLKVKYVRNELTKRFVKFKHEDDLLKIKLPATDTNCRLEIYYSGMPENGLIIGKNIFGNKTWFGDNWPNRASHWLPCIDAPASKAPVTWKVEAPAKYTVVANGDSLPTKQLKITNSRDSAVIWTYHISYPIPMKVAVIGIAELQQYSYRAANKATTSVSNFLYNETALSLSLIHI